MLIYLNYFCILLSGLQTSYSILNLFMWEKKIKIYGHNFILWVAVKIWTGPTSPVEFSSHFNDNFLPVFLCLSRNLPLSWVWQFRWRASNIALLCPALAFAIEIVAQTKEEMMAICRRAFTASFNFPSTDFMGTQSLNPDLYIISLFYSYDETPLVQDLGLQVSTGAGGGLNL